MKQTFDEYKEYIGDGDEADFRRFLQDNVPPDQDPFYLTEDEFDDYYGKFMVAERGAISNAHIDELMEAIVDVVKRHDAPVTLLQLSQEVDKFNGDSKLIGSMEEKIVLWEDISFLAVGALHNLVDQKILDVDFGYLEYLKQGKVLDRPLVLTLFDDDNKDYKDYNGPYWMPVVYSKGPEFDSFEPSGWYPEKYEPLTLYATHIEIAKKAEQEPNEADETIKAELAESPWAEVDLDKINNSLTSWYALPGPGLKDVSDIMQKAATLKLSSGNLSVEELLAKNISPKNISLENLPPETLPLTLKIFLKIEHWLKCSPQLWAAFFAFIVGNMIVVEAPPEEAWFLKPLGYAYYLFSVLVFLSTFVTITKPDQYRIQWAKRLAALVFMGVPIITSIKEILTEGFNNPLRILLAVVMVIILIALSEIKIEIKDDETNEQGQTQTSEA